MLQMRITNIKLNTKDSKYENGRRTLKDRQGTDAPNTSPYRLVLEKKKGRKGSV